MTPQEIVDKLKRLDLDGICSLLEDAGIVGIPDEAEHCPIARYIRKETGAKVVSVMDDLIVIDNLKFATPPCVMKFNIDFDCGGFLDLVDDAENLPLDTDCPGIRP